MASFSLFFNGSIYHGYPIVPVLPLYVAMYVEQITYLFSHRPSNQEGMVLKELYAGNCTCGASFTPGLDIDKILDLELLL